jgi:nicotinamidase-related amidase
VSLAVDRAKTALVVIDLQQGIAFPSRPTQPYPVGEVVANAVAIANAFRKNCMPVFLVHVVPAPETALKLIADVAMPAPAGRVPAGFSDFVPELEQVPSDIVITKRGGSAFYGTELDLQLRRIGVDTIVLCGIATDYGVESTARFACEYGYQQIFAEDAMTSMSAEQHSAAVSFVFRMMGRVRKTPEIIRALEG